MQKNALGQRQPTDAGSAGGWLRNWWLALASRERRLLGLAALLVGLALVWWVALAPAIATLRGAGTQIPKLEADLFSMQAMKTQAQALAALPRLQPQEARRLLETSASQAFGPASQLQFTADRVTVLLKNVPPDALAQWLVQTRANARMVPIEVRLARTAGTATANGAGWDGRVTLLLSSAP